MARVAGVTGDSDDPTALGWRFSPVSNEKRTQVPSDHELRVLVTTDVLSDQRSSFWVTFRNHTLMSPEAIIWLNQFSGLPLHDRQRLALGYLRHNERIANNDYQRLNRVDSPTAGRELRGLVQAGLIDQQSAKRWTYYTLRVPRELPTPPPAPESDEAKILARVREKGSISNRDCRELLGVSVFWAFRLLKALQEKGVLKRTGEKRWTRYELP